MRFPDSCEQLSALEGLTTLPRHMIWTLDLRQVPCPYFLRLEGHTDNPYIRSNVPRDSEDVKRKSQQRVFQSPSVGRREGGGRESQRLEHSVFTPSVECA